VPPSERPSVLYGDLFSETADLPVKCNKWTTDGKSAVPMTFAWRHKSQFIRRLVEESNKLTGQVRFSTNLIA
jgi:hypothetical protein